jgi:hypothetical protein
MSDQQVTLRLRRKADRLPIEHLLDSEYSLDEVQDEINTCLDAACEVKLFLASGDVLDFNPKDYEVISVAYPTTLRHE